MGTVKAALGQSPESRVQRVGGLLSQSWPWTAEEETTQAPSSSRALPLSCAQPRCGGKWGSETHLYPQRAPTPPTSREPPPFTDEDTKARRGRFTRWPASEAEPGTALYSQVSNRGVLLDAPCGGRRREGGTEKGRKDIGIAGGPAPARLNDFFTGTPLGLGCHVAAPQPPALHTVGV